MKSHEYRFGFSVVVRLLGGPIMAVCIFAALMRLGALLNFFPPPWPALDMDHTVLTHQARASMSASTADILFLGDSSCLMDVDAGKLNEIYEGKHCFLNLGSFMYVGWNGYAAMLERYARVNPGRLRMVLVFVHPEMLRGVEPVADYQVFLSDFYAGAELRGASSLRGQLCRLVGLNIFEGRLLSRLPLPLSGEYGRFYGFNLALNEFMERHSGSAIDPPQYVPAAGQGNAEYRLSTSVRDRCVALKAAVPPGALLAVALAPVPESFAPPAYASRHQRLLVHWGEQMQADAVLTNLPPTLPDSSFASTTHLNAKGSLVYTELLSRCLTAELGTGKESSR